MIRFTYPEHEESRIQIDLARRIGGTSTDQFVEVVEMCIRDSIQRVFRSVLRNLYTTIRMVNNLLLYPFHLVSHYDSIFSSLIQFQFCLLYTSSKETTRSFPLKTVG